MASHPKIIDEIFVTGFPQLVASSTIEELVRNTQANVHILVHPKDEELARKLWASWKRPSVRSRMKIYIGDVTSLDLGLSGEEYNYITALVTKIFHFSSTVDFGLPEPIYHNVNVTGAQNLIDMAYECPNLERLNYFSSIHVSGKATGVIKEDEFGWDAGFKNNLEKTRFKGEAIIRNHLTKLPITIFRLGWVTGDSRSGRVVRFEGPYHFMRLMLHLDRNLPIFLPGDCLGNTNFVPVDYVVNAALHISNLEESEGKTYHLTDPFPLPARTAIQMVCNYLGRKPPVFGIPRRLYKTVILIPGMERVSGLPKEIFDYFNHKVVHNCSNTLEALKETTIVCPRFESYFPIGIEFAKEMVKRRSERADELSTQDPLDRQ